MKTNLRLLVIAILVTSFGLGFARAISSRRLDGASVPIIVTPQDAEITAGDGDQVTITMNENVTSDTVVNVSCDSSELTVPSTVTVLNGNNSVTFRVSSEPERSSAKARSTLATITATANGGEAQGTITID